ncbi:TspO/MBR family protein [Spirosoma arcticum]
MKTLFGNPRVQWWHGALFLLGVNALEWALSPRRTKNQPDIGDYYGKLKKPPLSPPDWVFPVVWLGINSVLVGGNVRLLNAPDSLPHKRELLRLQGANWLLFATYSFAYARLQSPILSAVWTNAGAVIAWRSLYLAAKGDRKIAFSLIPLTLWETYASYLTAYQALTNRDDLFDTPPLLAAPDNAKSDAPAGEAPETPVVKAILE